MRRPIGILADDLTGSNDTGVQFARNGWQTTVYLEGLAQDNYSDVIVINTSSRHLDRDKAYDKVFKTAIALNNAGAKSVYKKIDSVMRGNIGAELDAVLKAYKCKLAFVTPAFPRLGRTVQNGILYVNGKPLTSTDLSDDILSPVKKARVSEIIGLQCSRSIAEVHTDDIDQGEEHLRLVFERLAGSGAEIVVLDALNNLHLEAIKRALKNFEKKYILAGSGGLASVLSTPHKTPDMPRIDLDKGILFVCGTKNKMAKRQIEYIREKDKVHTFEIGLDDLMKERWSIPPIVNALKQGKAVAVTVKDETIPGDTKEIGSLIQQRLSEYIGSVIEKHKLGALVLTGGDTAFSIAARIGAWSINLCGELEAGIPLGLLQSVCYPNLPVITKSGSFGDEATYHRILKLLKTAGKE
jgi:uncharacterized protein YgbK (DUF1537 family)